MGERDRDRQIQRRRDVADVLGRDNNTVQLIFLSSTSNNFLLSRIAS